MQIVDTWLRDMPQQFLGNHNIEVLIGALAKQMQEIQQVFDDMDAKLNLDIATGVNLDNIGTVIPLSRKEAGELAGRNSEDPVISDDRYRQFLRYKNLVNTNECTYYDLMNGLELLWDVAPIYYIEDPDMPATIILTMPFLKPNGEVVTLGEVPMVKPGGVRIEFQYQIKVIIEVLCRWIYKTYEVPLCKQLLCGQYPRRGSLGEIMYIETDVDLEKIHQVFDLKKTGTIRVGGKLYDSTKGEIITDDIEVVINSDYQIEQVVLAGQIVSGTHPIKAVNGLMMGSSIEADSIITNAKAYLPLSGTFTSGRGVMEAATVSLLNDTVGVESLVHVAAAESPACGSEQVSVAVPTVVNQSVSVEPVIQIAKANTRRCGTGACGNK